MKKLQAIFTITRLPNLVFIFLTQLLVYRNLIAKPILAKGAVLLLSFNDGILLALSTTLIAAGGYIINDYFDVKIDEINKPERVTVELQFKRRTVMVTHIVLDIIALALLVPIAKKVGHLSLLAIPILIIGLLVLYSAFFKRKPFIGNLLVAMLTATTVFLPALYEWQIFKLYTSIIIYCIVFFAFLLTLMREIVKDIEDIKGDATDGCSTLPIVMGVQFCKYLLYGLTLLFIAFMAFVGYKSITTFAWLNVFAILLLPMIGMVIFSIKLKKAYLQKHFKWLSSLLKIITFLGIIQIYFI